MSTLTEELEKLGDLLERGLLTREEFDKEKARLLSGSQKAVPAPAAAGPAPSPEPTSGTKWSPGKTALVIVFVAIALGCWIPLWQDFGYDKCMSRCPQMGESGYSDKARSRCRRVCQADYPVGDW